MPLEQSDLIRNYLLMNFTSKKEQDDYYYKYWQKIEDNTNFQGENKINDFFRYFLIYNIPRIQVDDTKLYEILKEFFEKKEKDCFNNEKYLNRFELIYNYSIIFNKMKNNSLFEDKELNHSLKFIINKNYLNNEIVIPFLFYLYNKYKNNEIINEEIKKILIYTKNILFRRKISKQVSGILRGKFNSLIQQLDSLKENNQSITYYDLYVYKINSLQIDTNTFLLGVNNFDFNKSNKNQILFIKEILLEIEKYISKKDIIIDDFFKYENQIIIDTISNNLDTKNSIDKKTMKKYEKKIGNLILSNYSYNIKYDGDISYNKKLYEYENYKSSNQENAYMIANHTDDFKDLNDIIYYEFETIKNFLKKYSIKWDIETIKERTEESAKILDKIYYIEKNNDNIIDELKKKILILIYLMILMILI